MYHRKPLAVCMILLNLAAIACLIYLAVPYLMHDTYVANPDAMIPAERWDGSGFLLVLGILPMLTANTLGFFFIFKKEKLLPRLAVFLPAIAEITLAAHYLFISFTQYNN